MNNSLVALLREFHEVSRLPIFIFNNKTKIIESFKLPVTPALPHKYINQFKKNIPEAVRLYTVDQHECFTVITTSDPNYHHILLWATNGFERIEHYKDKFLGNNVKRLLSYTRILYFSLFRRMPVLKAPSIVSNNIFTADIQANSTIINWQETNNNYIDYLKETSMLQSIETANLTEFNHRLTVFIKSGTFGKMATSSEIRNKKDLALAATTFFTRAAIKGGLHPQAAFKLSDRFCQQIEHMTIIESVDNLIQEVGSLFIERIRESNIQPRPEQLIIYRIKDYIQKYLTSNIVLDDMAKEIGYSKNYLCTLFKKNTHTTIIHYTNYQKIQEVKSQLIFYNKSIASIAESMGFSDQSYLTKLFTKYEKMTPKAFQKKFHI